MGDYNNEIDQALKYAAGKHGTPSWNPPPHPEADPDVVARRDSDPLWMGHQGRPLIDNGRNAGVGIAPWAVARHEQIQYHHPDPDRTTPIPTGMVRWADAVEHYDNDADADVELTRRAPRRNHRPYADLSPLHDANLSRYTLLFGGGGPTYLGQRRNWWNTVFPLQDLESFAAPHDPYRLLASSVLSGNRHALPHLVDLLKRRDNPAGWYDGWAKLAKAMDERIGDLPASEVRRRGLAIGDATTKHSTDPDTHHQLLEAARGTEDWTPMLALADHMEESGLPQYAQLLQLELANVLPHLRKTPKNKRSRL